MKLKAHPDWHWIVNHAWSTRFIVLAFLLSGVEVALPYFVDKTPMDPRVFAIAVGLVTGAAFVARLVAQDYEMTREAAARALVAQAKAESAPSGDASPNDIAMAINAQTTAASVATVAVVLGGNAT
jgi:hypothetical protein